MDRPVTILTTGGTIAMAGDLAVPALDAAGLVAAVPALGAVADLTAEHLLSLPGAHMGLDDVLAVARRAISRAREGAGVVVTHGTDTLEETAYLTDLLHDAEAPVVFTGAIRPASAPGADGPANLLDAVAVARAPEAAGLGTCVVFAGEVHAARFARKADTTSPRAFDSPVAGPIGHVAEGRLALHTRPPRRPALDPATLDFDVPIVATWLADDGRLLRAAAERADGVVLCTLGAGHVNEAVLGAVADVAARMPVVLAVRPARGSFARSTYGFAGAEGDLRATGATAAGVLSPQAARMKLLACLGAGRRDAQAVSAAFAPEDV